MDMANQPLYTDCATSTNLTVTVDIGYGPEEDKSPRLDAVHSAAMCAAWKTVNQIQKYTHQVVTGGSDMLDGDPGAELVGIHSYLVDGKQTEVKVTVASIGLNLPQAVRVSAAEGVWQAALSEILSPAELQLQNAFITAGNPAVSPLAALMQQHGSAVAAPEASNNSSHHNTGQYL